MIQMQNIEKTMLPTLKGFDASPWEDVQFYKQWLAQSYYYTKHSTRMLAFAAGWSPYDEKGYFRRSLQHIGEEQGHEILAIKDLEAASGNIADYKELGVTRALWEAQFYKMTRNPQSLLGYILALEYLAVNTFRPLNSKLNEMYPGQKHMFVKVHAEEDPGHVEEALAQIEKCSIEDQHLIFQNFEQTCALYSHFMSDIRTASQI